MSLDAGHRIAQYEILAPLGSGGMGEVYRARDLRLDREVAIKVMAAHIAADPEMRRRFETEARAVASLSHTAILSIYEMAITDGLPCAVMELLEGQNLRQRLQSGSLAWRDAVRIAASGGRRARRRARPRHRAPRSETGEHLPHPRRAGEDPGLRAGRAPPRRPARHRRRTDDCADRPWHRARHVRLHVAGTGVRRTRGRPQPTSTRSAASSTRC